MVRALAAAFLAALLAMGQEAGHKASASEYPAHAKAGSVEIGAENWGHGLTTPHGSFAADDFIVVDVALFGSPNQTLLVASGHFSLRLNKSKKPVLPVNPEFAAAMMKHPEWQQRPEFVAGGGLGNADVMVGGRNPNRVPGGVSRPVPPAEDPQGMRREPPPPLEEILAGASLASGEHRLPTNGYLFFPYRGKLSRLKSIELIYEGPAGSASLELR